MENNNTNNVVASIGMAGAAGAIAASIFKRRNVGGLIQKVYKKNLTPVISATKQYTSKFESIAESPFKKIVLNTANDKRVRGVVSKKLGEGDIYFGHRFNDDVLKAGKTTSAYTYRGVPKLIDDKFLYAKKMGDMAPKTWKLTSRDMKNIQGLKRNEEVLSYLDKKHGKGSYIYKVFDGAADAKFGQTKGAAQLIHSNMNPKSNYLNLFRKHGDMYIGQEKLNILKEYRVTAAGNNVISIQDRYPNKVLAKIIKTISPKTHTGVSFLPNSETLNHGLHKNVKNIIKKQYNTFKMKGLDITNNDIAAVRLPSGKIGYRIIEANYGSAGGQLENPIIAHKLYTKLTGRETGLSSVAKATPFAIAGGLSTYVAMPKKDNSN